MLKIESFQKTVSSTQRTIPLEVSLLGLDMIIHILMKPWNKDLEHGGHLISVFRLYSDGIDFDDFKISKKSGYLFDTVAIHF